MLSAVLPHSVVNAPVDPHIGAKAMLFVVHVFSLEATAIIPKVKPVAVHLVTAPFAFVAHSLGRVSQLAVAVQRVVLKLTHVDVSVAEPHSSVRAFPTFGEVSFVFISVSAALQTLSIWFVR